jgi:hypothetical protein
MSHHSDTSARLGVSPNPPKLPTHLVEALHDSEDPSFGVYDQVLHAYLRLARPAPSLTRPGGGRIAPRRLLEAVAFSSAFWIAACHLPGRSSKVSASCAASCREQYRKRITEWASSLRDGAEQHSLLLAARRAGGLTRFAQCESEPPVGVDALVRPGRASVLGTAAARPSTPQEECSHSRCEGGHSALGAASSSPFTSCLRSKISARVAFTSSNLPLRTSSTVPPTSSPSRTSASTA